METSALYGRIRAVLSIRVNERSRLARRIEVYWRYRITPVGRMLMLVLLVAAPVAGAVTIIRPLYYFAIFLFAFLLVHRGVGWVLKPRVQLKRFLPERCAAGATLTVPAQVTNTSPLPLFDFAVSEQSPHPTVKLDDNPEYVACIPPGASVEVTYRITPTRRGVYDFAGPVAMTAFPFGVYNEGRSISSPHRMLVYPRFTPLTGVDLPVGRRHQPGGLQMVSLVGDSEEFLSNREYRPGDRLRDIHHVAWARVGYPVVREFQQEYLCRIAMVVDTHIPWGRKEEDLESALSLGAAIADVLSRQEYVIDIFAAGPDLYHFQAGRSLAYLDSILDVLACIEPCRTNPFTIISQAIATEIGQISTAVFILLDWDEERERFVRSFRDMGVAVKVIVVRKNEPTLDPSGFVSDAGSVKVVTPEMVDGGRL